MMTNTMTDGQLITWMRESVGMSRRKLASKIGTSRRRIVAVETDTDVKPRKEKRVWRSLFVPFLGYAVRCYTDWPVRDTSFDLKQQQTRCIKFLERAVENWK